MLTLDIPYVPEHQTPIVLSQATMPKKTQPNYILKECQEVVGDNNPLLLRQAFNTIVPAGSLRGYLVEHDKTGTLKDDQSPYNIILQQNTSHGKLHLVDETLPANVIPGMQSYTYTPDKGYLGKDKAIFMIEFKGKFYKLILDIHVVEYVDDGDDPQTSCPEPKLIKVTESITAR